MSELIFYEMLSTRSKRAIAKVKGPYGRPYHYNPRGNLLERLSRQSGKSISEVSLQLQEERIIILRSIGENI